MSEQAVRDLQELQELHQQMRTADVFSIRPIASKATAALERLLVDLNNRVTFLEHQAPTHLAANLAMEAANDDGGL